MGIRNGQRALKEARMILNSERLTLSMQIEARVLLERACWELEGERSIAAEGILRMAQDERSHLCHELLEVGGQS